MIRIGVVGARNSGKTTLVEALVADLTGRGLRVATIKHSSHRHSFDQAGKDSYRHRQAGASATLAVADGELALFADPGRLAPELLIDLLAESHDICLIEGDRDSDHAKVLITRLLSNLRRPLPDNLFASYGDDTCPEVNRHFRSDQIRELAEFVLSSDPALAPEVNRGH